MSIYYLHFKGVPPLVDEFQFNSFNSEIFRKKDRENLKDLI